MAQKLVLLDGNSLANRAFYALRLFSASDGTYTNAVYGFLTMLYKLIDEEKPDFLAVAFDKGRVTFRTEQYAAYKGTRKAPPDEFRPQLDLLREVLTALNVAWLRVENFEADDLLGTLAEQASARGVETLVVTGDRDSLQLIDENVTVMMTKKGISEVIRYDEAKLKEEYGLTPSQIIDLKALMGDASDNIPGVAGVGEKTALKLLAEYGTLEGVYEHLDQVKGALKEKLANGREMAFLSKQLATISTEAPASFDPDSFALKDPNYADALPLFRRLEFKSLLPRVTPKQAEAGEAAVAAVAAVEAQAAAPQLTASPLPDDAELLRLALAAAEAGRLALLGPCRLEGGNPGRPVPEGVALYTGEAAYWLGPDRLNVVGEMLEATGEVRGHDLKPLYNWAYGKGLNPRPPVFDATLAAYLLDPARTKYELADLTRAYGLGELPAGTAPDDWATRVATIVPLEAKMTAALAQEGLEHLFREVEMPLLPILAEMEATGIKVSQRTLAEMGVDLEKRIAELTGRIHELAGGPFNIGSPKQLGEVLFERLGLPAGKKTKTGGYSTDAAVLEELAEQHEIVALILDYRTLTKIKSTYVDALGSLIARDGRIHTTFAQTVAETGRLSSKDPNLQNIPIRVEEGRKVRKAFVPENGSLLLAADYSQVELRVVAHYSGDPALGEAFATNQDIHTRTAAEVWGVPMDEVTPDMRRKAKAVNFGLIYGQTDFGLARSVGMSRAEAREFIETYFDKFVGVREYMDAKKAEAHEKGYVTTLDGRKRPLPEINHRIYNIRQNAERMAINTPIQGTAADLMKRAMITVRRALKGSGLKARMLLQVHDELVFECPQEEIEPLSALVRREMESAMQLSVPLRAEVKVGSDWYSVEKV